MNNASLLTLLPFILTIATAAAAAVAYFRASYAKATIDTLRDSNQALAERVGLLELEVTAEKAKTEALREENRLLRTLVPAEETLGVILQTLQELASQHERFNSQHERMIELLTDRPSSARTRSTDGKR